MMASMSSIGNLFACGGDVLSLTSASLVLSEDGFRRLGAGRSLGRAVVISFRMGLRSGMLCCLGAEAAISF